MSQRTAVLNAVKAGHNVLVLGDAGTGKTELMKEVITIMGPNRVIAVTGTTGIAATHLPGGMTIHRFCGIQDGRHDAGKVINKLCSDDDHSHVAQRIKSREMLIIDEVSMLSAHTFDLIEGVFRGIRNTAVCFGGVQLILCGDLHQLKPVPNVHLRDFGHYFITSKIFRQCVPHHFILETVYRQNEADLVHCIQEVMRGALQESSINLLLRLQRKLPPGPDPLRLFALTADVEKCNADHLLDMPASSSTNSDVEPPQAKKQKTVEYPCGTCGCECTTACVGCDGCDRWYHYKCLKITSRHKSLKEDQWFCVECKTQSKSA